jgi:excisionase family DNA binding protein
MAEAHTCERCAAPVSRTEVRTLCPACYRALLQARPSAPPAVPLLRPADLLTTAEAARLLGLQPDTLRRYVRSGRLRAVTVGTPRRPCGRRYRFHRAAVLRLLRTRALPAPPDSPGAGSPAGAILARRGA